MPPIQTIGNAGPLDGETNSIGRVMPQDIEAEKAVLSALLLDNDAIHTVLTEIRPEDFYHPSHQQLYQAMLSLQDENEPVDLHTLLDYLNTRKLLDAVGGPVTLAEIADYEATAANVVQHARIVRDKSVKRGLIKVATDIVEIGYDASERAERLLDVAESRIFDLGSLRSRVTFERLDSGLQDTLDYIDALAARGGELTGVPTGFSDFDEDTGGLQPGELIIIAARPSMGKTALALNVARNASVDHGKKVAIFSLEMTTRSLILRLLSTEASVDFTAFRKGFGTATAHANLSSAASRLSSAQLWLDDSGMLTILEIKAKCRRLHKEHGLDLVVVDYLQLAHGDTPTQRKDLEIGEISHGLKALAKELNIPVVALSQLNRGPEQRDPDKRRPNMGDLRESGAIEQDADVIAFIYRDEVYNKDSPDQGIAELIIAKQRNGPTGTIKLQFEGRYASFRDLSRSQREEMGLSSHSGFAKPSDSEPGGSDAGGDLVSPPGAADPMTDEDEFF
ncbi:replicative DNA helicase [Myxococcota bacterium]|nr:replicative DNA helicase [Myxococcota bacterium]